MGTFEDTAFMADLMVGTESPSTFRQDFSHYLKATEFENIVRLERVVDRLRAHVLNQVSAYRKWQQQYVMADDPLEQRYMGYEGLLFRQDLRQYWILYRHAMREYHTAMAARALKGKDKKPQAKRKPMTGKKAKSANTNRRHSNAA